MYIVSFTKMWPYGTPVSAYLTLLGHNALGNPPKLTARTLIHSF